MIQQETAALSTSRYNLDQVTLSAPFDGIVTRRNIEEGENVVVGTMNNAGTQLLTVADMSVIEAEVEVDETEIPTVKIGQTGEGHDRRASPGQTFTGQGDGDRQQPAADDDRPDAGRTAGHELQGDGADRRPDRGGRAPGFTCSAEITTGTRTQALVRAHPGDGRARAGLRQGRATSCGRRSDDKKKRGRDVPSRRCRPPSSSQDRRGRRWRACSSCANGIADVRSGEDRDRRRQVLRGALRAEARRPGDHRAVQLRAQPQGRRSSR